MLYIQVGLGAVDAESPKFTKIFSDLTMYQTKYSNSPLMVRLASAVTFNQNLAPVSIPTYAVPTNPIEVKVLFWRDSRRFLKYGAFSYVMYNRYEDVILFSAYRAASCYPNDYDNGSPMMIYRDGMSVLDGLVIWCDIYGAGEAYDHLVAVNVNTHIGFINFVLTTVIA